MIKNKLILLVSLMGMFFSVAAQGLSISSSAFQDGGKLPQQYSCNGENVSPPIEITSIPEGTQSLVLIMDDPDAPSGTWTHWVLYNLPATISAIPEKASTKPVWDDGTMQAKNDWDDARYGGACPPDGIHRYFFKLYALDVKLDLKKKSRLRKVEKAMKGHILAKAKLMAKYG
jgi:Raf kinase inhibitor-like YbhB/YbcL family protein